jgi:probable F420-dependent oxidoreductase
VVRGRLREGPGPTAAERYRPDQALTRPIRFATQIGRAETGAEWLDRARGVEALGYSTIAVADHMVGGAWAFGPALAAAAAVTSTLRVGTLVIDNDFRNPAIFARECATLDAVSGGRFELGVGAGWNERDYLGTGLPFDSGRVRVDRLAEAVTLLKRLFTEDEVTFAGRFYKVARAECRPKVVQLPHPPILIAGGGRRILALAGHEADIVAIIPRGAGGRGPGLDDVSLERMRDQIAIVREAAGSRFERIELSMFLDCALTDDREGTIAEIAERMKGDPALLRASAYRGIGTLEQIREHVLRVRDAVGVSYFCLRGPDVLRLGPIVAELTGR